MMSPTRTLRVVQRIRKLLMVPHSPEVREQLVLWAGEFSQKGSRPRRHAQYPGSRRMLRDRITAAVD
jgi:hypothetical protein